MPDEGFLKRWSRRKIESRQGQDPEPEPEQAAAAAGLAPDSQALAFGLASRAGEGAHTATLAPVPVPAREADAAGPGVASIDGSAEAPQLPTLDDVAALTPDSDYSGFVARGVDQAVRRSALKKLFADPHFNTMDRLDVYIDDYTKPSPVSEAMLASMRHATRLFERVADEIADADAVPAPPATQDEVVAPAVVTEAPEDPEHQQHPPETETR